MAAEALPIKSAHSASSMGTTRIEVRYNISSGSTPLYPDLTLERERSLLLDMYFQPILVLASM